MAGRKPERRVEPSEAQKTASYEERAKKEKEFDQRRATKQQEFDNSRKQAEAASRAEIEQAFRKNQFLQRWLFHQNKLNFLVILHPASLPSRDKQARKSNSPEMLFSRIIGSLAFKMFRNFSS